MSDLQRIVWQVVAAIPAGQVMSYGMVAKQCGYPSHARYVGWVLKQLPADTQLPWHRVVNAKGAIAFPAGSAAYCEQKQRLEAEGLTLINGRVRLSDNGY